MRILDIFKKMTLVVLISIPLITQAAPYSQYVIENGILWVEILDTDPRGYRCELSASNGAKYDIFVPAATPYNVGSSGWLRINDPYAQYAFTC